MKFWDKSEPISFIFIAQTIKIPQSEQLTLMGQLQMLNGTIKLTSMLLPQVV